MPPRKRCHAGILVLLLAACTVALRGDYNSFTPREQQIGKHLICTCGCRQGALVCTTLNCSVKLQMQAEIRQRARLNEPVSLILQSFVQEYGTEVIANPTHTGFNESAWVIPWVIAAFGLLLVLLFIRRLRPPQPAATPGPVPPDPEAERLRAQVAADIERDLHP